MRSRDLLPVGVGAALSGCVNSIALNGDNFIIGRTLGAASLGLYGRAYTLMTLPFTYTAGVLSGVLFPAFARMHDDPARLRRGFLVATELTAVVSGPAMAGLAVAAPHVIPVLYGAQWSGAVPPLQVLCAAGYFRALYHVGGVVLRSQGRVYTELSLQIVYAALVVTGTAAAARYGLTWAAVAVAAAIVFMCAGTAQAALRASGTSWAMYFDAQRVALITTAIDLARCDRGPACVGIVRRIERHHLMRHRRCRARSLVGCDLANAPPSRRGLLLSSRVSFLVPVVTTAR